MHHSVWNGRIHFGLLCFPAKLCAAARHGRALEFHLVHGVEAPERAKAATAAADAALSNVLQFPSDEVSAEPPLPERVERVRQAWVSGDGRIVPKDDLLLGWEYRPDQYAVFRKPELDELWPPTSKDLRIVECVDPREIDLKYYADSFDVWPDDGGEQGYEVLYFALADNGLVAITQASLSRRDRLIMIRPNGHGLVLHKLFFPEEVRLDDEYHVKPGLASKKDRELGSEFAKALTNAWEPGKYKNTDRERVFEFVLGRCQSATATNGEYDARRLAPVVSIEETLRRSIEMLRKPPRRERGGSGSRKKRKGPQE